MGDLIQLRRGLLSQLQVITLQPGEFGFCTDTGQCFIGDNGVNTLISHTIPSIFEVSPYGAYQTISSAISAAVTAGHTSNDNPAVVMIANGTYNENIVLKAGIHLVSMGSQHLNSSTTGNLGEVVVVGNHTYAPAGSTNTATARVQNRVNIVGINFVASTGMNWAISGAEALEVVFYDCVLLKPVGGDTNFNFQLSSTASLSRVRFNDTILQHEVANAIQMDLQNNTTAEFRGKISGCVGSIIAGVTLQTGAQLNVNGSGGTGASLSIYSQGGWGSAKFNQLFTVASATAIVQVDGSTIQNTLASTPASGTITVANAPNPGDTVTVNGWVYTAVASGALTNSQFNIGGSNTITATNLAAVITQHQGITEATSSGAVVTVKTALTSAFTQSLAPAAIANSVGLATSNSGAFTLSGSTLSGGVDGGYIVNFTANGTVRLRRSGVFLNDAGCKIANGITGQIQASANSYSGVPGSPQCCNWVDPGVGIYEVPNLLKKDNLDRVYVDNNRGFVTIQEAINYLASQPTTQRKSVLVGPGFYQENLVFADNVDLIANTLDGATTINGSPVNIVGKHSYNPVISGSSVQISGISFTNIEVGGPVFSHAGSVAGSVIFKGCNFYYPYNDGNSMFAVSNTGGPTLVMQNCSASLVSDSAPAMFDFTGSNNGFLKIDGNLAGYYASYGVSPSTLPVSSSAFVKDGSNLQMTLTKIQGIGFNNCQHGFIFQNAGSTLDMSFCQIFQSTPGEMFLINTGGYVGQINGSSLNVGPIYPPNTNYGNPVLMGDGGVSASGTITVTAQPNGGDTITVNGVVFTCGVDFAGGGTLALTAQNIATAITSSGNPGIQNIVYAVAASNVVTVTSYNSGLTPNSYVLATSNGAAITLSGSTLSGGTVGAGGTINVGNNSYGFNNLVQSGVSANVVNLTLNTL